MPDLKPVYLVHGDDHGAVAERRAGLRRLLDGGEGAVEVLEGDRGTPAGAASSLAAMTLAMGWRAILVEGAERWRAGEIEEYLGPALAAMPPQTTLAMFAREEAKAKVPAVLHELVAKAGGQVVAQMTVKPWELAKWVREQAGRMGLALDAAAAKALVETVGERQQRLLRELEKMTLEGEPGGAAPRQVDAHEIERHAARSSEWRAYGLADALVGAEQAQATRTYLRLRQQGERISGLTYLMASRLREALAVALRLGEGQSTADVKRSLRMPSKAADRLIADVRRSDPARLRQALVRLADLELDTRGGAPLSADRGILAGMDEDTLTQCAIEAIATASTATE